MTTITYSQVYEIAEASNESRWYNTAAQACAREVVSLIAAHSWGEVSQGQVDYAIDQLAACIS